MICYIALDNCNKHGGRHGSFGSHDTQANQIGGTIMETPGDGDTLKLFLPVGLWMPPFSLRDCNMMSCAYFCLALI